MINVRVAENSDKDVWDAYVRSHPDSSPYHLFAWGKAVAEVYGHKTHYFLAEQDRKLIGIFPLVQLRFPLLLNELVSLPYCDMGGPLCDGRESFSEILSRVLPMAANLKAGAVQIRGQCTYEEIRQAGFTEVQHNKVRMLLDLPESSRDLMEGFKSKLRSQIRKAEKNDLIFEWGTEHDLDDYYSVFSANMHALGSPVHDPELFRAILRYYGKNAGMGLVYFRKKAIGAGLILMNGKKVSIPWASTLRDYNRLSPNMLLYWNFLKYAADNGYQQFDFGRSSKGGGTYKFKVQWGAQAVPLPWYSITTVKRRTGHTESNLSGHGKATRIWRQIPLPAANFFGPLIRKYINL
ncbi:MAG: GNAT family N-acetyltransferase [Desulfobulbaceae bacterium]|nr:GNAT family N-acetyltransferase [Desulfobulbaceae bacterium]